MLRSYYVKRWNLLAHDVKQGSFLQGDELVAYFGGGLAPRWECLLGSLDSLISLFDAHVRETSNLGSLCRIYR